MTLFFTPLAREFVAKLVMPPLRQESEACKAVRYIFYIRFLRIGFVDSRKQISPPYQMCICASHKYLQNVHLYCRLDFSWIDNV